MTLRIVIRPKASLDLDDHFDYLSRIDAEAALQFFDAARLTFAQIARTPGMGSRFFVENPNLQELRKWPIKNFKKYLIFYLEYTDRIEVVRILYGSRNLNSILERD